jgi:allantoinase
MDCLIRGGNVVLADGVAPADVAIAQGTIVAVGPELSGQAREVIDARGLHVLPGVCDVHVHFNDPGRSDWEGGASGSAALVAGGGTCFCDMPLNASPPTLDAASFELKRAALEAVSLADFGLWGGLVPDNHAHLAELAELGVIGFKAFMCPSGIADFAHIDDDALGRGMEIAAGLGLPVAVHAEDATLVGRQTRAALAAGRTSVRDFLESRPVQAEVTAIERALRLAEQTGCSLHVVHVSSGEGIAAVVAARQRGVDATCETCPHYLVLEAADMEQIGAAAKCAPPLRGAGERAALWEALRRGEIDLVASDHSPAPWAMKIAPNFFEVWGGIAGCQTLLGLMLSEGSARELSLSQIAHLTATAPAARFGLARKGRIEIAADADLTLVDLADERILRGEDLRYRHPISPFVGRTLRGAVRRTMVRGETVLADGTFTGIRPGRFVRPVAASAREARE